LSNAQDVPFTNMWLTMFRCMVVTLLRHAKFRAEELLPEKMPTRRRAINVLPRITTEECNGILRMSVADSETI